jgi:hypothetical protein
LSVAWGTDIFEQRTSEMNLVRLYRTRFHRLSRLLETKEYPEDECSDGQNHDQNQGDLKLATRSLESYART